MRRKGTQYIPPKGPTLTFTTVASLVVELGHLWVDVTVSSYSPLCKHKAAVKAPPCGTGTAGREQNCCFCSVSLHVHAFICTCACTGYAQMCMCMDCIYVESPEKDIECPVL